MNIIEEKEDERIKKDRENPMVGIPMINQRDMRTIVEFLHQYTCVHRHTMCVE